DRSKKGKKKKKKKSSEDAPLVIAPGRSSGRHSMMPAFIDPSLTYNNPSDLADPAKPLPLPISQSIVGRAGLVRDRDGLVYDPENPQRVLYRGEDGRASRIVGAISKKQAKAMKEKALEAEEKEQKRTAAMEEARRIEFLYRVTGDISDGDEANAKAGVKGKASKASATESEDSEEEKRVVHRLPKNFVPGGIRYKNRRHNRDAVDDDETGSEDDDVALKKHESNLMKVGAKVTASLSPEALAQARQDLLQLLPGRNRVLPQTNTAMGEPAAITDINGDETDDEGEEPFEAGAILDQLKPGRSKGQAHKVESDATPERKIRADSDSGSLSSEGNGQDVDIDFQDNEDEEEDNVPLQARAALLPKVEAVTTQKDLPTGSTQTESPKEEVESTLAKNGGGEDTAVPDSDLTDRLEEMRHICKNVKNDPLSALDAAKFIIENVRNLDADVGAQKFLCNLAVRTLNRVGLATNIPQESSSEALFLLANLYISGIPGFQDRHKPDYTKAFHLYASAAKKGHADALFHVALCYEQGAGAPLSNAKALHNYSKAARLNHPGAMFRLGMSFLKGELGQQRNTRDGIKWLKLSAKYADQQYPHALYELAMMHDQSVDKNIVWTDHTYLLELLSRAAELGHSLSQYKMGEAYEYGLYGCETDPERSVYYYSLAAANGQPEAMFELGGWYLTGAEDPKTGYSLTQSDLDARKWVSLAAEAGLPRAMFALGYFNENGIGDLDGPDLDAAVVWYRKAADEGEEKAIKKLEEMGLPLDSPRSRFNSSSRSTDTYEANGRAQLGIFASNGYLRASKRPAIDEELDGGNKCVVM
ncbi:hypothetical protein HDU96_009444, partial [Phlyctochytrium bullatum]